MASTGAVLSRPSEAESGIAVQTISEPDPDSYRDYQDAGIKLRAVARIRMQEPLEICLDAGARQKP
jgi:hypothetical protein